MNLQKTIGIFCVVITFGMRPLHAGDVSHEVDIDYSFVGGARTSLDHGRSGNVAEQSNLARYVISPQIADGPLLRIGVEWQRFSFSLPDSAPLPNTLQSTSLVLGADLAFAGWLMRIETQPGFYSDFHDLSSKDFFAPFIVGASYISSADLQWIVGMSVNVDRRYPVIPAVGVRWKFADQWTLNAIMPSPRLEYEFNKSVTLFVGGDFKGGTYRVDSQFGDSHENVDLNNAIVDYTEIRVGSGASWKISSNFKLDIEAGYMAYREFDFHRADVQFKTDSGAPYGQIILTSRF